MIGSLLVGSRHSIMRYLTLYNQLTHSNLSKSNLQNIYTTYLKWRVAADAVTVWLTLPSNGFVMESA